MTHLLSFLESSSCFGILELNFTAVDDEFKCEVCDFCTTSGNKWNCNLFVLAGLCHD